MNPITKKVKNPQTTQQLRQSCSEFQVPEPLQRAGIEAYNIGLVGDMGNGKSSFINLLLTCLQTLSINRIPFNAPTGTGESTLTREIKKYLITNALNIFDRYGTQMNEDFSELGNFVKGRLLPGFRQGGAQNEENDRFRSEASLKSAPHLIIYIIDIRSAENPDSVRKFGEIYRYLKQEHGVHVLIGLTKLDKLQENNECVLDESELDEALENSTVKRFIEKFAQEAQVSEHEILPIFNYTGSFEERSQVKESFALILLEKVIQAITIYFQKYTIAKIIDQNGITHYSLLLEDLDVSLDYFTRNYSRKISNQSFRPVGFFTREDKIIPEDKWNSTYLSDIRFDYGIEEGYQVCTLKLQNDRAVPDQARQTPH